MSDRRTCCAKDAAVHTCRPGCVVYSFGSDYQVRFERKMLERTACEVHVFDPTVLASEMRRREERMNAGLPRQRVWFHNWGVGGETNPRASCAPLALPDPARSSPVHAMRMRRSSTPWPPRRTWHQSSLPAGTAHAAAMVMRMQ